MKMNKTKLYWLALALVIYAVVLTYAFIIRGEQQAKELLNEHVHFPQSWEAVKKDLAPDFDELDEFDDDDIEENDDEIAGYVCLGCGHQQDDDGPCEVCTGWSTEPIYF
jgi:hypothetical protein